MGAAWTLANEVVWLKKTKAPTSSSISSSFDFLYKFGLLFSHIRQRCNSCNPIHLLHHSMAHPNIKVESSESEALAAFDIRRLEEELARRKRKHSGSHDLPSMITTVPGNSASTPIDLTQPDSSRADTPMDITSSASGTGVTVKVEHEGENEITVNMESESEGEGPGDANRSIRNRKRARKEPPPAPYKAHVHTLAQVGTATVTSSDAIVDDAILERIKKCIARYSHATTPENEAKIAFRTASRLMEQYNISQADVTSEDAKSGEKRRAGQSVIVLLRSDGDETKPVKHFGYVNSLCWAMGKFFDCKHYTVRRPRSLDIVFYGLAENTITAALAFEMAYNLISEWARAQKGSGPKNSYCLGASWQLEKMAKEEKAAEEARAVEAEKKAVAAKVEEERIEDEARLSRLQPTVETDDRIEEEFGDWNDVGGAANSTSGEMPMADNAQSTISDDTDFNGSSDDEGHEGAGDDNDDAIEPDFVEDYEPLDINVDLEEAIRQQIDSEPLSGSTPPDFGPQAELLSSQGFPPSTAQDEPPLSDTVPTADGSSDLDAGLDATWVSHMQLMTFRKDATKIAEDYLQEQGKKLRNGRKKSSIIRDFGAYKQGREDGKTINVHQKQIKDETAWEDDVMVR